MTANDIEVARIKAMELGDLMIYILENPEYLSDSYYIEFKRAIDARAEELGLGYE